MGDTAKVAGVGPVIDYNGKRYQFGVVTPVAIGRFESVLEARGWDVIDRYAARHSPAKVKEQESAHRRDCATDVYAYGSDAFKAWVPTPAGMEAAALIFLQEGDPTDQEITPEFVHALCLARARDVMEKLAALDWITLSEPDAPADQ